MVGLAQMVRASDCGPEGHQFDPGIPPQYVASVVQRLVYKFSKLGMRFRLPPLAPGQEENENLFSFYFCPPVRESTQCLLAPNMSPV